MRNTDSRRRAVSVGRTERTRPTTSPDDPIGQLEAIEVRSAEQEVYEALRHEIVHGLPPGTPLRLAALAERFRVSTMPVRSAIARLESEGLVVHRPRRGAVVTDLTAEDFIDLYAIRMALEGVAARCGCVALGDEDLERMRECHCRLTSSSLDDDEGIDHYLTYEWQLHDICYQAAGRPRLMRLIRIYRRHAERYFRRYLGARLDLEADIKNQENFLTACQARDPERAEAAIRALFDYTTDRLLPGLAESATPAKEANTT